MMHKLGRKVSLNKIYLISIGILIILLTIQSIRLENYINDTRNFILDELEIIDTKIDLTDIEKEIDKLEERITDLENGG